MSVGGMVAVGCQQAKSEIRATAMSKIGNVVVVGSWKLEVGSWPGRKHQGPCVTADDENIAKIRLKIEQTEVNPCFHRRLGRSHHIGGIGSGTVCALAQRPKHPPRHSATRLAT